MRGPAGADGDTVNTVDTEVYRSPERLTFFSDARYEGRTTSEYLRELFAFALSFVIIASFWRAHHALFEHVAAYSQLLLWLNILWMFTVVWLPVPTAGYWALAVLFLGGPVERVVARAV